ncbi:helix-turn-helix domain-containing protein [Neobacillus drentensis]|uniref:helix-turn-helix domain-containing protein n=1 Tax=Neobacillus drentensis TaxID=220684 RepID=UPI002FFF2D7E
MTKMLYELVKEAKYNNTALETIIKLFEPKLKKSMYMTNLNDREDLVQELKEKMILYIKGYDIDSVPGFWQIKDKVEKKKFEKRL